MALFLLPLSYRHALRAVYDVVRVIDDTGDAASGDRTAQLTDLSLDLARGWEGAVPDNPAIRRLMPVVRGRGLSRQPFDQLVEANLMDQVVGSYETFDDVLHYCSLSASPVGHLVLEVFGQSSAKRRELSNSVCMALQLLEHWQDVAEDYRAGRIYLPRQDLRRFAVDTSELGTGATSPAVRLLVAFETDRAAALLETGAPLVSQLHGWARLAVAGYVAGGRATVDALRRAGGDVLPGPPKPLRRDVLRHLAVLLGKGTL